MNNKITPIIIIGSGKCGTTTLYNHLIKHSGICAGKSKEPEYFTLNRGDDYNNGSYDDIFKIDFNIHKFTIDASTGYSMCHVEKGVPQRMTEYGLNPYFIYIIRNPFDRIRSHYNFNRKNLSWKQKIDSPHLINTSMYYRQLEEYKKVFGGDRTLLLEFEDLKNNPEELCNKIFDFIGAEEFQISIDNKKIDNKTEPINRTRLELMQILKIGKAVVPVFMKKWIVEILKRALPDKQKFLSNNQKMKIKKALKDDMNNLRKYYNVDISKWGF